MWKASQAMVEPVRRTEIIKSLRERVDAHQPLVIAGVSTGETARAAERGGADLLLFYNSGRFRMAGRGSLAGLMPYADANAISLEMAREINPVVNRTPVIGGVCATDPFRNIRTFLREMKELGVSGVINYPTVCMTDGQFREGLEEQGMSFSLEVSMIKMAREMEMLTVPYAFKVEEAEMMATAGADLIIIHTGYHRPPLSLDQAVQRIRDIVRVAKKANPDTMFFCHGGPIEDPESFNRAYEETDVVGFMGFTGIERLPAVNAIQERVKEFKRVRRKR
jgi:predicted TIM-barrel enzyme